MSQIVDLVKARIRGKSPVYLRMKYSPIQASLLTRTLIQELQLSSLEYQRRMRRLP